MAIIFRTTDGAKWGAGKGGNLTPVEVDLNFWEMLTRVVALEGAPSEGVGIDHFTVSGTALTVFMTNGSTRGPFTLPTAKFTILGEWEPATAYPAQVFVTNGGQTYLINYAHTSAGSFDAGANDGMGHNYYGLLPFPTDRAYDVGFFYPGTPGAGLPDAGTMFARVFSRATYLPAALPLSVARLEVEADADMALPIYKNATLIGSILFAAGETEGTFTFVSNVSFAAGDRLRVVAPTADVTASDLTVNFVATKGTP